MIRFSRRSTLRALFAALSSSSRLAVCTALSTIASSFPIRRKALAKALREPVTAGQVDRAIRNGVVYLKSQQQADGSWPDSVNHHQHIVGPTSLVLHALLTAGEPRDSPHVVAALRFLEKFSPDEIDGTYSVGLQTMVFAETDPQRYLVRITANVSWLERAQIKEGDNNPGWPGSWAHTSDKARRGDNSSTQFALLGLNAAALAGVPVNPEVWALFRKFLVQAQQYDGGWPYYLNVANSKSSASTTCAGISGLIITGQRLFHDQEQLVGETIHNCGNGRGKVHPSLRRGLDWISTHFSVSENPGSWLFRQWKHYYLYGMERVGRFSGLRFLGTHDWYREGAEELVATQHLLLGSWTGVAIERQAILATSLAVLFLATGRSPVLVNKLRHGPGDDWNNDLDDVRNLVGMISNDWHHRLTWQIVDPDSATVEDMLQAPIAYFNGHEAPQFSSQAKMALRAFVEQGGFIIAEACCGDERFDRGFRTLVQEVFPEEEYKLHPLDEGHAVWRAHHRLSPDLHPLWGIEHGCRTVLIYSPADLSCFWNQMEAHPSHPRVILAQRVGQNLVDYATGREIPADKLVVREVKDFRPDSPKRGALHIAKLRHAGDWNVAPLAIPSLTNALKATLGMDVTINHKELFANDPTLVHYPLIYAHGCAAFSFSKEDMELLRRHFQPGGGCLFADAACGSPAFDAAFRKFVATLFPNNPLVPIPHEDALYSKKVGYDLSDVQYTQAAGGGRGYPQLEGVKLDDHWALIYSRYDLGCALERHSGIDCKGYSHESALKIATNIVIFATLP
ncbi:hypothetical protein Sinac_3120 [Singulisphaera acidiphila DSM 18658]|uniref:DUF4159 domain-containing protein n=2 Tax=Singulisphaera acidiphila TaxID=466153 RepID=L0DEY0_SINAD|nr:hypothetical protein Sinac_3120 [Singulisphaera acidiphila DSM 18658]